LSVIHYRDNVGLEDWNDVYDSNHSYIRLNIRAHSVRTRCRIVEITNTNALSSLNASSKLVHFDTRMNFISL
jgi:hypothetical protein